MPILGEPHPRAPEPETLGSSLCPGSPGEQDSRRSLRTSASDRELSEDRALVSLQPLARCFADRNRNDGRAETMHILPFRANHETGHLVCVKLADEQVCVVF